MLFKRTIARIERRRFVAKIHALILVTTMVLVGSVASPACGSQESDFRADAGAPRIDNNEQADTRWD